MNSTASAGGGVAIGSLLVFILLSAAYFTPLIIAILRKHQIASVAVINILLGWTVAGWIVALVMAVSDKQKNQQNQQVIFQQQALPIYYTPPVPPQHSNETTEHHQTGEEQ